MKLEKTFSLDVGYPIYGAKFLNDNLLLVTGGGGEGSNGIPNKLTAIRVNFDKPKVLKKYREIQFPDHEDSPMSIDATNDVVLVGVNQSSASIAAGVNKHLKKFTFKDAHLQFVEEAQIYTSRDVGVYQKCTYLSPDASSAAISTSAEKGIIYLLSNRGRALELEHEVDTGGDVKDMHFSPDGKALAYVTANSLEIVSPITGNSIMRIPEFKDWALSKIRFIDNDRIVIGAALKKGEGIVVAHISVPKKKVLKSRVVSKKIKGITSMDYAEGLVALAGSDSSVTLLKVEELQSVHVFPKVHNFAITRVAFSPSGKYLVSTSAAKTVQIVELPKGISTSVSIIWRILNAIYNFAFIALLAVVVQYIYANGHYEPVIEYLKKNRPDSSLYFSFQKADTHVPEITKDVTSSVFAPEDLTIKGDIVSITSTSEIPDATFIPESTSSDPYVSTVTIEERDVDGTTTVSTEPAEETTVETSSVKPVSTSKSGVNPISSSKSGVKPISSSVGSVGQPVSTSAKPAGIDAVASASSAPSVSVSVSTKTETRTEVSISTYTYVKVLTVTKAVSTPVVEVSGASLVSADVDMDTPHALFQSVIPTVGAEILVEGEDILYDEPEAVISSDSAQVETQTLETKAPHSSQEPVSVSTVVESSESSLKTESVSSVETKEATFQVSTTAESKVNPVTPVTAAVSSKTESAISVASEVLVPGNSTVVVSSNATVSDTESQLVGSFSGNSDEVSLLEKDVGFEDAVKTATQVTVTGVAEASAVETSTGETPVDETSADETPVDETSADETSADETPVDETPIDETLVDETPVDETPVDETSKADTSTSPVETASETPAETSGETPVTDSTSETPKEPSSNKAPIIETLAIDITETQPIEAAEATANTSLESSVSDASETKVSHDEL